VVVRIRHGRGAAGPWLEGQGARSGAGVLLVVSVFVCGGGGGVWVGGDPLCRALLR
jgi:hypothetical protein